MPTLKRPFKMTETEGRALERMRTMFAPGFGFQGHEAAPFAIRWVPPVPLHHRQNNSRFFMPSLMFGESEVARLGYRNRDGFLLLRQGLPEEVEQACASRYRRLIEVARRNLKAYEQERAVLAARADALLFGDAQPLPRDRYERPLEVRMDFVEAVRGAHALIGGERDVLFSYTNASDGKVRECHADLVAESGVRLRILSMAEIPYAGRTKMWFNYADRGNLATAFAARCTEALTHAIERAAGQPGIKDDAALLAAVQKTDFGYM